MAQHDFVVWFLLCTCLLLVSSNGQRKKKGQNKVPNKKNIDKCLISPGYPNNYTDDSNTRQTLSVPAGQSMEITFQDFDVEEGGSTGCWDYVEFSDGNGNIIGRKLCGTFLPMKFTIRTSTASVLFKSDGSVTRKGFKFCYKPENFNKCLTSSGYPNNYTDNSNSRQTLSVPAGQSMEITFQDFDVEESVPTGCWDYVEFSDGNGNIIGKKLCGTSLPKKFTISTSTATVLFKSDGTVTRKGFKFCYMPDSGSSISCKLTPRDAIGPFYLKKKYTLETKCIAFNRSNPLPGNCNDDEYLKKHIRIQGRVLDSKCRSIEGAIMEYWQAAPEWSVSHKNVYTMVDSSCTGIDGTLPPGRNCIDTQSAPHLKICEARQEPDCITDMKYKAYRGWQRTTGDGSYQLNTVGPGIYEIRPIRHIHIKITVRGHELVTQLYLPQDKPTKDERNLYKRYMQVCQSYESKPEQWAKKQDLACPVRNDPEGASDVPNLTTYNWDVVLNV